MSSPIKLIWLAVSRGTGGQSRTSSSTCYICSGNSRGESKGRRPSREDVEQWMARYPSGLDPRIVRLREENRERILRLIIEGIDRGEIRSKRYAFPAGCPGKRNSRRRAGGGRNPRFISGSP